MFAVRSGAPCLFLVLAISTSIAADDTALKQAMDELRSHFKGKSFVALAPLSFGQQIRRCVEVSPGGEVDPEIYRRKMSKFGQAFAEGDSGKRIYLEMKLDDQRLVVMLFRKKFPQATVCIEFGRPLVLDDLRPEVVVRATSRLISIEGELPPDDFDAESVRSLVEIAGGSSANLPIPSAPPPLPSKPLMVTLLAAEVEPNRLAAGETIELRAVFELDGGPGGTTIVSTEYQVHFDGQPVNSEPVRQSWDLPPGRQTLSSELSIPADAPSGVYTVTFGASWSGGEAEKSAIFVVEAP